MAISFRHPVSPSIKAHGKEGRRLTEKAEIAFAPGEWRSGSPTVQAIIQVFSIYDINHVAGIITMSSADARVMAKRLNDMADKSESLCKKEGVR